MGRYNNDDRVSRNVSLLISMLVRYPEVVTVRYDPRQQTIRISIMVRGALTEQEFEALQQRLTDTVEVYNLIAQRSPAVNVVTREELGDLTSVSVTRDVVTMTPEEVWTIVEFFREWSPERLVVEAAEAVAEEEMAAQDEMIEEVLADLRGGKGGRNLIAIREEGRVILFQR